MRFVVPMMLLGLAACSETERTIDATSDESLRRSVSEISATLSSPDREKFEEAVALMAISSNVEAFSNILALFGSGDSNPPAERQVVAESQSLHGKTAAQVLELADARRMAILERQLDAVERDIAALKREIEQEEQSAKALAEITDKIEITSPRFRIQRDRFSSEPVVEFNIANVSDRALKRVFFRGLLETPGRSVPWVDEEFNYEIRGGLEPGESRHLALAPNMFSPWGDAELEGKEGLVLTVEVLGIEDASGERLKPKTKFGGIDRRARAARLEIQRIDLKDQISRKRIGVPTTTGSLP